MSLKCCKSDVSDIQAWLCTLSGERCSTSGFCHFADRADSASTSLASQCPIYACRSNVLHSSFPHPAFHYIQVAGNFVTAPISQRPKGVVHFLGGAFAGAAPQLAYQFLINWVANAGYTVVATPYAVTFRHLDCAARVHQVRSHFPGEVFQAVS